MSATNYTTISDYDGLEPSAVGIYYYIASFAALYGPVHGVLSNLMCIFGLICNMVTIIILSKPSMRNAVNTILVAMAVCNCIMHITNIIFTSYTTFVLRNSCDPRMHTLAWAIFVITYAQLTVVAHSSSVWLSVTMAAVRIKVMRSRCMRQRPITETTSMLLIAGVTVAIVILNIPHCLIYTVHRVGVTQWRKSCPFELSIIGNVNANTLPYAHVPGQSAWAMAHDRVLLRAAFWITGCMFKMLPCVILPLLIFWLTNILAEITRRRARLNRLKLTGAAKFTAEYRSSKLVDPNRTTKMLILIVCVFLITELPQGAMAILTGILDDHFQMMVYNPLADFLDLLALTNSCATFLIYSTMSAMFRQELMDTFLPETLRNRYDRVEHRESIVPDTPLFAALKNQASLVAARPLMTTIDEDDDGDEQHEETSDCLLPVVTRLSGSDADMFYSERPGRVAMAHHREINGSKDSGLDDDEQSVSVADTSNVIVVTPICTKIDVHRTDVDVFL